MHRSASLASVCLVLFVAVGPAVAQVPVARDVEPVILTGADIPDWSGPEMQVTCQPYPNGALTGTRNAHNSLLEEVPPATGVDVDQIVAFRWNGSYFQEIPVQVDEMYYYCLSNPDSDFAFYSGTDKELSYAWDDRGLPGRYGVESWKKTAGTCTGLMSGATKPDPVPTLDNDDEIVFMASDATSLIPPLGMRTARRATTTRSPALRSRAGTACTACTTSSPAIRTTRSAPRGRPRSMRSSGSSPYRPPPRRTSGRSTATS